MSTEQIELKIAQAKKDLAELEKALVEEREKSPDQSLAETLHGLLCNWNHTDGCGWFYEFKDKKPDWSGHSHATYLGKAHKLISCCEQHPTGVTPEQVVDFFKLIKGL